MPGDPREVAILEVPAATLADGDYIKVYDDSEQRTVQTTLGKLFGSTPAYNVGRNLPTGALAATMPRNVSLLDTGALTTTKEQYFAIYLTAGMTVTSATFVSGTTAAGTPVNQWFCLRTSARVKVAITADDTSTAWAANTAKTLTFSSPYVVPTSGLYYLCVMVKATTPNSLAGAVSTSAASFTIPPIVAGQDATTVNDTPANAAATGVALTAGVYLAYAYVS